MEAADRDAYLDSCAGIVESARQAPGCLEFSITADLLEADRINVFERWESDEQLEGFRGGGPSSDQADRIRSAEVQKYRISSVEEP